MQFRAMVLHVRIPQSGTALYQTSEHALAEGRGIGNTEGGASGVAGGVAEVLLSAYVVSTVSGFHTAMLGIPRGATPVIILLNHQTTPVTTPEDKDKP